jgi:hypothetical protein
VLLPNVRVVITERTRVVIGKSSLQGRREAKVVLSYETAGKRRHRNSRKGGIYFDLKILLGNAQGRGAEKASTPSTRRRAKSWVPREQFEGAP